MRFSRARRALAAVGGAACGPTFVVQGPPQPAPQRVPVPPRVSPLEVSIVRPEEGRVLIQTSRPAYVAVFEIVPGRGVALVYPGPMRSQNVTLTGLTWVNVYWTMRPSYDRRFASSDTRYIYAVASDTPLRIEDEDHDGRHLERRLGSGYYSSSPNATVRAISREFVRAQPDEWWGEDMFTMALTTNRVTVTIRLARVYCPGGNYFEVREDVADHVWCPTRVGGRDRPGATAPDSVFSSNGRRVPRHMDPTARTPIFRVPAPTDVGQQQGQPQTPPQAPPRNPLPTTPPQNQPPQTQPQAPPQNQPPQTQPQDPNGKNKDHEDNGRRAHGDPRNADPRGNGNGYGNGGREQPSTQPPTTSTPPATVPPSNPQPQQQGQPQNQPGNNGHGNGTGNANDHGKSPNEAKPDHADAPKNGIAAILKNRGPQPKQDDKNKKAADDSTDKKKP
jgi:hypothetical protein